jgi:predicted ATPase/DNA-binding winged helix-turn-helix (wHTH) protein
MSPMVLEFGEFEIDTDAEELRRSGRRVAIQPKILSLLTHLVRASDRVVTRRELHDTIWAGVSVSEASLARAILEARRAIGDELQQIVVTVRGRGFRFAMPVREHEGRTRASQEPTVDESFVGRDAIVSALEARVGDALVGRGKLVWLVGELGMGKTRLVDEVARRARVRGVTALTAQAHDRLAETPFALWGKIVRAYAEIHATAPPADAIAPIVSGARVAPSEELPMFDQFARWLGGVARTQPLLVVLEDVHASDADSMRLLQFLGHEVHEMPVLIAATCRETAIGSDDRGRALASALRAHPGGMIPLRGLGLAEIERYIEIATGVRPTKPFAQAVLARTSGNPLYVGQLLKTEWADRALNEMALEVTTSIDLQQGLVQSIQRHLDSVSPASRDLLTTAAVLGREFGFSVLAAVSDRSQAELLDALDAAAGSRVIAGSKNGVYRFTPALVRDVLYKGLSSAEREQRHRVVAERLRALYADTLDMHAAELAYHFARALPGGDPEPAIDFSVRAARLAAAVGSFKDAAKHWERATRAMTYVRTHDVRRAEVHLGLADAYARSGDEPAAHAAYLDAAMLAQADADASSLAAAALGFAALASAESPRREALLHSAIAAIDASKSASSAELRARLESALAARAGSA